VPTLRTVAIDASRLLPPREQSRLLAEHARRARDALIAEGRAAPQFLTYVDGRLGAPEESVRPDGAIRYVFSTIARAAAFALAYAEGTSPVLSGDFRRAWIVVVNGARWSGNLATIPPGAVVHLVNTSPYARRLEVGRRDRKPGLGYKLVEKTRQQTRARFPTLQVNRIFLAWREAWVLKGGHGRRKDRASGQRITLPAVEIRAA
jgi:hypothetical protein